MIIVTWEDLTALGGLHRERFGRIVTGKEREAGGLIRGCGVETVGESSSL